ncbi:hypothetical protein BKA66DRAFT_602425 [Pyrenochaeta sp. MPI-SDFR-AT-0127]|nr:hypothetical protein BKA66DRAFT_602425 [Pyrenochaeta sp. MPI-SDFR-AT-0127]
MRLQSVLGKVCLMLAAADVVTAAAIPIAPSAIDGVNVLAVAASPAAAAKPKPKASAAPKPVASPAPKAKVSASAKPVSPPPSPKLSPPVKPKVTPTSRAPIVPPASPKAKAPLTPKPAPKVSVSPKPKAGPSPKPNVTPTPAKSTPVADPPAADKPAANPPAAGVPVASPTPKGSTPTPVGNGPVESVNPFVPERVESTVKPTTPDDGSEDGPDNLRLRLVVPAPVTADRPALNDRTIKLNGKEWYLTEAFRTPANVDTFPNFTAISYRWYDGRLPNPFFDGFLMSNLTLPSLESAMRNAPQGQEAFWIDCFSIPAEKPLKGIILDLLSNIFDAAHEVIVPLGLNDAKTLPLLAGTTALSATPSTDLVNALKDLNQEEWVKSIWTYKEVLSAKNYIFTDRNAKAASGAKEAQIKDLQFFKKVGEALDVYKGQTKLTSWDIRKNLTQVDALEDLGLARQLKAPYEGSVFEALANLDRRFVESDKNFFWGFYGVLTLEMIPASKPHDTLAELYERLFELCEKKKDYSFVYTSAERQTTKLKTFYPKAGALHSIITMPGDANYQSGSSSAKGVTLDGMVTLKATAALGKRGKDYIQQWFKKDVPAIADDGTDKSIASKIIQILQMVDYSGSKEYIVTDDGIFFPQTPAGANPTILVTSQLGWSFGSPGFAKTSAGAYIPGAFVGHVAKDIAAPVLMA